ncbi:DEAD/DEAH box helicase domain protein [Desulfovibrio sp. X2]|uniref:DEAD/DEAH box helicase n=1 Tax=Desulfovibrio sp. X2 TaxID=941449 RepID=UPI000358BEE7|nr:DEAD/DEAH box helicase [Desulfovibrio sp. X2]EPR37214.1 DEAD/DEAH box helicase domain protein [Desulfovibrio sp. X2]
MEALRFDSLPLSKETLRAVADMGFEEASPIQALAIPLLMEGRDVVGQAQTGTGKTAAFGIPVLEMVDPKNRAVQAIVLCPTRELAIQVAEEFTALSRHRKGLHVVPVYGGQPIDRQFRALRLGAQVVIGTPGRVMDHMERGTLDLGSVRMAVLDEADEMLDMGFREDIEHILDAVPEERQTVFFSATMAPEIMRLAEKYLDDPAFAKVAHKVLTVPSIEQIYYEVHRSSRLEAMCRVLDFYNPKLSIVFSNTKRGVDQIVETLQARGYLADGLHGDMSQSQRDRVMGKFRGGTVEILVATDVAARGIDVEDIEAVFNYDVPSDVEYYVHRIGRTGRAGRKGRAFSFAWGKEFYKLRDIQRYTKAKIVQQRVPSLGDVEQVKTEKFLALVRETIAKGELEKQLKLVEEFVEQEDASSLDLAAALLKMLLGPSAEEKAGEARTGAAGAFGDTGAQQGMVRLFMSVGRSHTVAVKDVVGAIAGETGLPGRLIGKIEIYDKHSYVEVPEEYAADVVRIMNGNQIRGNRVSMEPAVRREGLGDDGLEGEGPRFGDGDRGKRFGDRQGDKFGGGFKRSGPGKKPFKGKPRPATGGYKSYVSRKKSGE